METADDARRSAQKNTERMQESLPLKLARKEDNLPKRIKTSKGDALYKLGKLYRSVDEIFVHINKFTACSEGCSACCHIPAFISQLEVANIEIKTGVAARSRPHKGNYFGQACPFLKESRCSIYEDRPLVCRKHVSFASTSYWCAVERCQEIDMQLIRLSGIEEAYQNLLLESGMSRISDIRENF